MTASKNIFLIVLALVFTVPAAIMHGKLTKRWDQTDYFQQHVDHLHRFPAKFGDWTLIEELPPLNQRIQKELGFKTHINRVYEDSNGNRVTALIMVGPSGPLVRHPVEVCYNVRTKQLIHTEDIDFQNDQGLQKLRVRRYEPNSELEDQFLVAYGFCVDNSFDVPASPRIKYGAKPVLYKIQILSNAHGMPKDEVPAHLKAFVTQSTQFVWPQ